MRSNKGFLSLWTFLFLAVTLHAEHVQWQGNYEKARLQALKAHKKLMVFLMEKECAECTEMLRTTFQDQKYIRQLNRAYVSVLVFRDQKRSYPIELLYTLEYPTLFFLDAQEHYTRKALRGYTDAETLKAHLQK